MENKLLTLHTIYDLVRNNPHPTTSLLLSNELILRQSFPWDEVVNHLNELQAEGLVIMKQLSIAAISITEKGLQYVRELMPVI
jgi:Mn-dependent DtxR family transcriptional regulator